MKNITDYILYELEHLSTPEPVVTIIGDLNYDYIYTSPPLESGKEVIIRDFTRNLAGASGYVACGLSRLGARVYLLTQLGDDDDGHSLYEEINRHGVEREGIKLVQNKKTPFTLIFAEDSEKSPRQAATYLGTLETLTIDSFEYEHFIEKSVLAYSCNYFLMPRLREEIKFVFRLARKKGILTSYDANAGDGWEEEKKLYTLKNRIYPLTDIIFLNQSEAYYLTGEKNSVKAIKTINRDSMTVVIKLGKSGSLIRHRDKLYRIDAFPVRDKIMDTVGAGDSYQAAFLYFLLRKLPVEICGICASANAASSVRHSGGTGGQLDYRSLANFIRRYKIFDRGGGHISVE